MKVICRDWAFTVGHRGFAVGFEISSDLMYVTTKDDNRVYLPLGFAWDRGHLALMIFWLTFSILFPVNER